VATRPPLRRLGNIQQVEDLRARDPLVYEALKKMQETSDHNAGVLNDALVTVAQGAGYVPQGVLAFLSGTQALVVPPPIDPNTDPNQPADPVDPNNPIPPHRLPIILVSRGRHVIDRIVR
jgi:hypothetical protein